MVKVAKKKTTSARRTQPQTVEPHFKYFYSLEYECMADADRPFFPLLSSIPSWLDRGTQEYVTKELISDGEKICEFLELAERRPVAWPKRYMQRYWVARNERQRATAEVAENHFLRSLMMAYAEWMKYDCGIIDRFFTTLDAKGFALTSHESKKTPEKVVRFLDTYRSRCVEGLDLCTLDILEHEATYVKHADDRHAGILIRYWEALCPPSIPLTYTANFLDIGPLYDQRSMQAQQKRIGLFPDDLPEPIPGGIFFDGAITLLKRKDSVAFCDPSDEQNHPLVQDLGAVFEATRGVYSQRAGTPRGSFGVLWEERHGDQLIVGADGGKRKVKDALQHYGLYK